MAYCTEANVRARLPLFPDDEQHDAIITEAISAVQADVDAALAARYSVPFEEVPDVIQHITADLAAAWALDAANSGGGGKAEKKLSQSLRGRGQRKLDRIVDGKWRGINTLVARGTVPGQASRPGILTSTQGAPSAFDGWVHPGLR